LAHSARVDHATCPEDGELVDVVPQGPELAHSDEGAALPGRPDDAGEHQHRHCVLTPHGRQTRSTAPRSHSFAPSPVEPSARAVPRSFALTAQIAVYRIA